MADLGFHLPSLVVYLVNFTILLGILYMVGYKPILRMLDDRSERIKESVEAVQRAEERSAQQQADMEAKLEEGRREGQAVLAQARDMSEKYKEEERGKAKQEGDALLARARAEIRRERDEAIDEVRSHFAELAITAAERVIERSVDASVHKDIIAKVLEESPGVSGRKAN
jgi:F-type H+-transporting ATPase subunit b